MLGEKEGQIHPNRKPPPSSPTPKLCDFTTNINTDCRRRRRLHSMRNLHADGVAMSLPPASPSVIYLHNADHLFFSSIPLDKTSFDIATVSVISALLLLSLLSFSSVFYLRFRSRQLHHLENFNSLWTVRLLLVSFAFIWSVNELLRLPLIRGHNFTNFPPSETLEEQSDICRIHVVLSLGVFEPSFLITLLFLVKVSIKRRRPSRLWALVSLLLVCSIMTFLQIITVYFSPLEAKLPMLEHDSSIVATDEFGNKMVLCTYPFFSSLIFGSFAIAYAMAFLMSCWRVTSLVINKGMRRRINMLAAAVMVALSVQIGCLSLSWLWMPEEAQYGLVVLVMFLFVSGSMAVGEVVLVLKPIKDSLEVVANYGSRPLPEIARPLPEIEERLP